MIPGFWINDLVWLKKKTKGVLQNRIRTVIKRKKWITLCGHRWWTQECWLQLSTKSIRTPTAQTQSEPLFKPSTSSFCEFWLLTQTKQKNMKRRTLFESDLYRFTDLFGWKYSVQWCKIFGWFQPNRMKQRGWYEEDETKDELLRWWFGWWSLKSELYTDEGGDNLWTRWFFLDVADE